MPLPLYLSSEAARLGSARELRRQAAAGEFVRVRAGVYATAREWATLDSDARYRELVHATALVLGPQAQFSHQSAAALWRLPALTGWPRDVHQLVEHSAGGTSRVGIRRHGLGLDPTPTHIDGIRVTSLARTLVDIACTSPFVSAVLMLDDALRPTRPGDERYGWASEIAVSDVRAVLGDLLPYRGSTRARRAFDFATDLSGSPGETVARVHFHALGIVAPELQVPFYDRDGLIGFADFYWPHLDLIGEFDGASKYGDRRRYQRTMPIDQIVLAEKEREDRMRRVAKGFMRLRWAVANDRRALARRLAQHGLHARESLAAQ